MPEMLSKLRRSSQWLPSRSKPFFAQIQRQATTAAQPAMTRATFDQEVNTRFNIGTVRTGTMQDQIQNVSRFNRGVTLQSLPNWQSWSPGAQSALYDSIIAGISDFAAGIGGIPPVTRITFYEADYDIQNGTPIKNTAVGADYSGGELNIYSRFDRRASFPNARSTTQGNYPSVGGAAVSQPAGSTGAPIPYMSADLRARQTISHELGHGLAEAAYAANPNVYIDYNLTAGWFSGKLYDAGVAQVQTDLTAGTQPNASFEITDANWNAPNWIEQPMSRYSLTGAHEDLAEAIAAYVHIPGVLRARAPRRYAFIHTNLPTWRAQLRSVASPGSSGSQVTSGQQRSTVQSGQSQ